MAAQMFNNFLVFTCLPHVHFELMRGSQRPVPFAGAACLARLKQCSKPCHTVQRTAETACQAVCCAAGHPVNAQ